jgi:hypothetical protein
MADAPSEAKKGKRVLQERRLVATGQHMHPLTVAIGFAGAGALGAGTYARWLTQNAETPVTALLVAGLACAVYFAWQLSREGAVVRVGDAGVALDHGTEIERLLWCDIVRIHVDQDHLVLNGTGPSLSIAVATHARAISWILREAAERLPKLIDVTPSFADQLPRPESADGTLGPVASLQTTGRRCATSRKVIRYERDARLCTVCTQVYLRDEVPKTCVTCGRPLEGNIAVP